MGIIMLAGAQKDPPAQGCFCFNSTRDTCHTRGCSAFNNPGCDSGDFNNFVLTYITDSANYTFGCNCPGYNYSGHGDNGYYGHFYHYINCTSFSRGNHNGTNCCHFCCGSNSTTTI